jgi:hypothetical protein
LASFKLKPRSMYPQVKHPAYTENATFTSHSTIFMASSQ